MASPTASASAPKKPRFNDTLEASLVTFLVEFTEVAKVKEMVAALKTVLAALESGRLSTETGELREDATEVFVDGEEE